MTGNRPIARARARTAAVLLSAFTLLPACADLADPSEPFAPQNSPSANAPPEARIRLPGRVPLEGAALQFRGSLSSDPDAGPDTLSYVWHMGDGTFYYVVDPIHAFASDTTWTVTLWVSDGLDTTMVQKTIDVLNRAPEARLRIVRDTVHVKRPFVVMLRRLTDVPGDTLIVESDCGIPEWGYNTVWMETDSTFTCWYGPPPGQHPVHVRLSDDDTSVVLTDSIYILNGVPVARFLAPRAAGAGAPFELGFDRPRDDGGTYNLRYYYDCDAADGVDYVLADTTTTCVAPEDLGPIVVHGMVRDTLDAESTYADTVTVVVQKPFIDIINFYSSNWDNIDLTAQLIFEVTDAVASGPYTILVRWGDGTSTTLTDQDSLGSFQLEHIYDVPGTYDLVVRVTDANGVYRVIRETWPTGT